MDKKRGGGSKDRLRRVDRSQPPEKQTNRIEWVFPEDLADRAERMRERAAELGCIEATEVMLQLAHATEGFTRTSHVYAGPYKEDVQRIIAEDKERIETARASEDRFGLGRPTRRDRGRDFFDDRTDAQREADRGEEQARQDQRNIRVTQEQEWRRINELHATFDRPDAAGPSDWLRALGAFRAALQPGEGIPGAADVTPPRGGEPSQEWQQFSQWCREKHIHPLTMVRLVDRLRSLGMDMHRLGEAVDNTATQNLNQIIMAGMGIDALYVNDSGRYHTISELLDIHDPERQQAQEDAVRESVDEYRRSPEFMAMRRDVGRAIDSAWYEEDKYKSERRGSRRLGHAVSRVREEAYRNAYDHPTPVEISRQSAAYGGTPLACFIATESAPRRGDRRDDPEYRIGTGIHTVDASIIRMLVGEDNLVEQKYAASFNPALGGVVLPRDIRLKSMTGPAVERAYDPETGEEAVALVAKSLATHTEKSTIGDIGKNYNLPFIEHNKRLLYDAQSSSMRERSRHRLNRADVDVEALYAVKLRDAGNPTTIPELQALTNGELNFTFEDLLTATEGTVSEILEEADQLYPEYFQVGDLRLEVQYTYTESGGDVPEQMKAVLKPFLGRGKKLLLQLKESDISAIGSSEHPVAVEWNIGVGSGFIGRRETFTSLAEMQDAIDSEALEKAWGQSELRAFSQPVEVDVMAEELPDTRTLVAEHFPEGIPPYTTAKNGEPRYPVAALVRMGGGEFALQLVRTHQQAENAERRSLSAHLAAREQAIREAAVDQEQVAEFDEKYSALQERIVAQREAGNLYAIFNSDRMRTYLRACVVSREELRMDQAVQALEDAEQAFADLIAEPGRMFTEVNEMIARAERTWGFGHVVNRVKIRQEQLNTDAYWTERDGRRVLKREHSRPRLPSVEKLREAHELLSGAMAQIDERDAEDARRQAKEAADLARYEAMDQQARRAELDRYIEEARQIGNALRARVNRPLRRGLDQRRARVVMDIMDDARREVERLKQGDFNRLLAFQSRETLTATDLQDAQMYLEFIRNFDLEESVRHFKNAEGSLYTPREQTQGSSDGAPKRKRRRRRRRRGGNSGSGGGNSGQGNQ